MGARLFLFCMFAWSAVIAQPAPVGDPAQTIVHMLDYVSVDYPEFVQDGKVLDESEYAEQVEFARQALELLRKLPDRPRHAALVAQAQALQARIDAKASGAEVANLATALRWGVIEAYNIAVSPKRPPDFASAAKLYRTHCAGCHGTDGRGDGPASANMDPRPSNFHDAARMASRSVYGLYSTISLGVAGTPMASFAHLTDEERWALAFHVAALGTDPDVLGRGEALFAAGGKAAPYATLRGIATLTDNEVKATYGADAAAVFAWLKRNPHVVGSTESPIAFTERLLGESLAAYRAGNATQAQQLAVTGYLEGFELVEASLDALDRALRQRIEGEMVAYRNLLRSGATIDAAAKQADQVRVLLAAAAETLGTAGLSPAAAAVSAFFILVREGLEALLVVAAILAVLAKAGRREALWYIHAGWIGALALGVATWFVASYAIAVSGAGREVTEGVTALAAAAILLYVGFWLHGKAYAQRWKAFIAHHLQGALAQGTLWALAGVSFLAVYREAFETVLFYEALWTQAGADARGSVLVGFLLGAAALTVVGWLVFRYGMRLPIGPFFAVSSVLMAVLAVMFAGHGVAALQEAGWLPIDPIAFKQIPELGIYANAEALGLQGLLLAVTVIGFVWTYASGQRHSRTAAPS